MVERAGKEAARGRIRSHWVAIRAELAILTANEVKTEMLSWSQDHLAPIAADIMRRKCEELTSQYEAGPELENMLKTAHRKL